MERRRSAWKLRGFRRSEDGSLTVEAVIVLPILFAVIMMTFVFHDVFSFRNIRQKATYTVADILSRETDPVTADYLDNAKRLYDTITQDNGTNTLRVSLVSYDADTDTYAVAWSEVRGADTYVSLTTTDVRNAHEMFPDMADEERLIVVETMATYRPFFQFGLGLVDIPSRALVKPRFAPQVVYSGS